MGWVKTKDIPEDVKPAPPLTISVNKWSGVRLNSDVYTAMGRPKWVELEYDEETNSLRFKPGPNIVSDEVVNQNVKVPLLVRSAMSHYDKRVGATQRWLVELREDGWWYTTEAVK
jgi:hypothetical protein